MDAISSFAGYIGSAVESLKTIELSISYLYVIIYAVLLLLAIMFSSKRALIVIGVLMGAYLGILKGYPYIAASLDAQPLLWILYLVFGLLYLIGIGLGMFLDR